MKVSSFLPQDQVYWFLDRQKISPLREDIEADVVVVGGGMAGLTAAQEFAKRGKHVVLIERSYCGAGATGKSSGFVTPNSELSLTDLVKKYGEQEARQLWEFVTSGVEHIRSNIQEHTLVCDYHVEDTLVVANSARAYRAQVEKEHTTRLSFGYPSTLHSKEQLRAIFGCHQYEGGFSHPGTFGINGYDYCQGLKDVLLKQGVRVYEETPAIDIQDTLVKTAEGSVRAQHIIVCTDYMAASMQNLQYKVYHAQTVLMVSAQLNQEQVKKIFPATKYMVWDTDLIYNYYRIAGHDRLLLGGATLFDTFSPQEKHHNSRVVKKLSNYLAKKFPDVSMQFEYVWPGLIGISKDIVPIAGFDAVMPSVYYITAATGLPWAAALGAYSAARIADGDTRFDGRFSPYRNFPLGDWANCLLGTRLTFAISNFLSSGSL